ncbi:Uncharacterized protein conserved in bacteria [Burkholderia pseudomallei]|nr:Uncharacterized protein conserved in bacteria [Burkholderia pseudomallei]
MLRGEFLEHRVDERLDVRCALAQRRRMDRQHVQPVIKVRAKAPFRDERRQFGRRRRDDPHIRAHDPVRADRLELLVLQHAQQLALQRHRHVADFVEKERAAVGKLELADAPLAIRARVRARRRAEELGFEQRIGNRRDVDGHERLQCPRGRRVDRMREQLLTGARLAEQQHRRIDLRGAPPLPLRLEAHRARADEARERVFRPPRLRERALRRDQLLLDLHVARKERRERLQLVEQREADRADGLARVVRQRQARDDERLAARLHDVEQDRAAGRDHLAHQAVRNHRFAIAADRLLRIGKPETRRVTLIDPDDARHPCRRSACRRSSARRS